MNKLELVTAIARRSGLSKAEAVKALEATIVSIETALKKDQKVRLAGLGTFSVGKRKATVTHNPRTGEEIRLPKLNNPRFKAGETLKNYLN
ncbi:MAG: HU family DNA-binding protein [Alphaproteobacteria bacterium]|nr:HU family DNA-binding protein [Alphaproteobacteria bacterium]